jgi:hypothetical protein
MRSHTEIQRPPPPAHTPFRAPRDPPIFGHRFPAATYTYTYKAASAPWRSDFHPPTQEAQFVTMIPSFSLLIHLALYNVAYSVALEIGPARVDVDVFMSLDHQTSSTPSATSFTVTTSTMPTLDATSEYFESTQLALHPYSRATSYVASAWNELNSALRDSETSTSDRTSSATSHMTSDEYAYGDSSTVYSPQSSIVDLPRYPQSGHLTSTQVCDSSSTEEPTLFASTTGPASRNSISGGPSHPNATGTWTWPPVVSAWPSSSSNSGNSTPSSSQIVQLGGADGKSALTVWTCWAAGALVLAAEARSML